MSKLKLLLLGGVFTLVGIFNFSSAEILDFQGDLDSYSYSPRTFTTDGGVVSLVDFSCNGVCGFSISDVCSIVYEDGQFTIDDQNGTDASCIGYDFSAGSYTARNTYGSPFSSLVLKVGSDDVVLSDGFGTFTPVIDGLSSVVTQFIPLVVYISIGFIIAVLGFYAIKWLCNWFLIKINSVFKSKRG